MSDLTTISPDQLSEAVALSADAQFLVFGPAGPIQRLSRTSLIDIDAGLGSNSNDAVPSVAALRIYVAAQIASLVNSAPGTLDTLGEIAAALAADEGALAALTATVSGKLAKASNLSDVVSAIAAKDNISKKGADIASAATTDLAAATGDFVNVTGVTAINSFGVAAAGVERVVCFTGALTLTHNAASLILPTAADISVAAGDIAHFRSLGGGNWRCTNFLRADGRALLGSVWSVQNVVSAATVTPTFLNDQVNITAQAVALTLANPTGTIVDGRDLVIRIKDNGAARAITYGSQYRAVGVTLPTTTVAGLVLYLRLRYNAAEAFWDVITVAQLAVPPTSYADAYGSGNRTAIITSSLTNLALTGNLSDLLNGNNTTGPGAIMPGGAGDGSAYMKFQLSAARFINGIKFYQSDTSSHGVWRWEWSDDNATWTQLGADFNLGGAATSEHLLAGVTGSHIWWRMRHMSGVRATSPFLWEIEFKAGT